MAVQARTIVFDIVERKVIGGPENGDDLDMIVAKFLSGGWTIVACGGAGAGGGEFKPSNIRGWEKYFGFMVFARG